MHISFFIWYKNYNNILKDILPKLKSSKTTNMKQLRQIHYTLADDVIIIMSQQILSPINSLIVSREEKNCSKIMKWKIFPII